MFWDVAKRSNIAFTANLRCLTNNVWSPFDRFTKGLDSSTQWNQKFFSSHRHFNIVYFCLLFSFILFFSFRFSPQTACCITFEFSTFYGEQSEWNIAWLKYGKIKWPTIGSCAVFLVGFVLYFAEIIKHWMFFSICVVLHLKPNKAEHLFSKCTYHIETISLLCPRQMIKHFESAGQAKCLTVVLQSLQEGQCC